MKVAFHTLGCKVNQYESEAMAKRFRQRGHQIVGEREFADVYVINTCTVTAVADKKSRQYIRRMKKVNPQSIIAVTGCYAQIDPEAVSDIPEVDIVTGTNEKGSLPEYVEEHRRRKSAGAVTEPTGSTEVHVHHWDELTEYEDTGIVTSAESRTRAYIKIQEGCNRFCSYCIIPYARGSMRSRGLEDILAEANQLLQAGYREIVLTGINTALYGYEAIEGGSVPGDPREESAAKAGEPYGVERVIAALDALPGEFRIRLSSLEPAVVNAAYVKRLLRYPKLCHHLHLSAQSGSDRVLGAMNRPYDRSQYLQIVAALREFDPCYGISTDIIVGFPGEKEPDFRDSLQLVEESDFCKVHAFKYSRRPGTKAASMKEQISPQIKDERSRQLQAVAKDAQHRFCEKNLGREETVLFEEYLPQMEMLTGYTGNYIRVYCHLPEEQAAALENRMVRVKLTETYRDGCIALIL